MIYQQINSQQFHIGTSAHDDWAEDKGAIDITAPNYDSATQKARWDADTRTWVVKTIQEWDAIMNPPINEGTV